MKLQDFPRSSLSYQEVGRRGAANEIELRKKTYSKKKGSRWSFLLGNYYFHLKIIIFKCQKNAAPLPITQILVQIVRNTPKIRKKAIAAHFDVGGKLNMMEYSINKMDRQR